jgi:shikimate kinase
MPLLALIGFMAAGKTTIGQRLASLLGRPFLDLDASIESAAGASIAEIFAGEGEAGFRRHEAEALERALAAPTCVLAAGGGTVLDPVNRRRLRERALVVWLDLEFSLVRERLVRAGASSRPLFESLGIGGLARLYEERRPAYAAAAHVRISPGRRSAPHLANQLSALVGHLEIPEPLRLQ